MKKLIILLFLIIFSAFSGEITKKIDFPLSALSLTQKDGYTVVDLFDAPYYEGPLGSPQIPVIPISCVIPPNAYLKDVEILEINEVKIPGEYLLYPIQYGQTWSINQEKKEFVLPKEEYYSLNTIYPEKVINYLNTGNKGGFKIGSFLLFPVRYLPAKRELYFITSLKVKIVYEEKNISIKRISPFKKQLLLSSIYKMVCNPEDAERFSPYVENNLGKKGSLYLPPGYYEYVIITPNMFVPACSSLLYWRNKQGYPSTVMTIEEIQSTYPGRDLPEKMRNFIKDADTIWQTPFFFIVRQDHPAQQYRRCYVYYTGSYRDTLPCDLYFSDLDGDWDFNRNNIFGEVADSVDGYSDVYVGMIPVDSLEEITRYISKVFRFEKTPDNSTLYPIKVLLPVGVTFSQEFNDSIYYAMPAHWFGCRMYMSGGSITPTPQRYCDSINSGYGYTSIIAHGSETSYDLGGSVTIPMMMNLNNTNKLNVLTAVCCHTGAFDYSTSDCIAEYMTTHSPNGFAAVMMNSRYGWVRVAEYYNYHFFYKFLPRQPIGRNPLCSAYVYVGEALAHSKDQLRPLWPMTDSSRFRWEAYERNLFGCPMILLWTDTITYAQVNFPSTIPIGSNIPVYITVSTNGIPIESALVCLWKGNEVYAKGKTNSSGEITLYVTPQTPGNMLLTVSGRNFYPYEDSILVIPTGRYVAYRSHLINDDPPRGNGDGIPNPGEELEIPVWVKNFGELQADNVYGYFFSRDTNVTYNDTVKFFGNIPGGDSAFTGENGFNLTLSNNLTNGYSILCSLKLKDAYDSIWYSRFTITVGTPILSYEDFFVKDSFSQRPNGRIDPGETADVLIKIRNTGLGHGYNVYAILKSSDTLFTIVDSFADFGTVLRGDTAINFNDHFKVFASQLIRPETEILCTLKLYADNYERITTFRIPIGRLTITDPIPDNRQPEPLYYAYDDVDTFYQQTEPFEWVEIRNVGTRLPITSDDQTIQINLPFPFRYYGVLYTGQLSVCGNGWITPVYTTSTVYTNQPLPDPTSSNPSAMICPNWDDLYPPTGNGIWFYYDTLNHRMILEWDSVHYYNPREQWDKFQIIIYDTTVQTPTGDNIIKFQYLTANYYQSNTVGIEDQTNTIGICAVYNNNYHRASAQIQAGRAIKLITGQPLPRVNIFEFTKKEGEINKYGELQRLPTILKGSSIILPIKANKVAIYDITGKKIKDIERKKEKEIKIENLPTGIYIIKNLENKKEIYKIIITK
ncbi:MAG: C25 family cysteine peptidase [candidate division WOR-3 bacterium]